MYFSRIMLNQFSDNKQLVHTLCHNVYGEHQVLWKFFDKNPKAQRDFLYRRVLEDARIKYYILSKREPKSHNDLWDVQTKKYSPNLKEGQKLSFMLKVNPVVSVLNSNGEKKRCDIIMHEKNTLTIKI